MDFYNINNVDNIYYITNLSQFDIDVVVKEKTCKSVGWKEVKNFTIPVSEDSTLHSLLEGFYHIQVTYKKEEVNPETEEIEEIVVTENHYIKNYYNTLKSLVEDLKVIFCETSEEEDPCNNCSEEEVNKCDLILSAYSKMEYFKRMMNPYLTPYLNVVYKFTNCYTKKYLDCFQENELLNGKYQSPEFLLSKMLAFDYIALYLFFEKAEENNLMPSFDFIKEFINSNSILCCIEDKYGILLNDFYVKMAKFEIQVEVPINLPPSQVGDNFKSVLSKEGNSSTQDPPLVFTSAMFTTETTPAYEDPEGDAPFKLRIDTLPESGVIEFNEVPVVIGQEILLSDVDLGLLVYHPDEDLEQDNLVDFNFSVSDVGSEQFTS